MSKNFKTYFETGRMTTNITVNLKDIEVIWYDIQKSYLRELLGIQFRDYMQNIVNLFRKILKITIFANIFEFVSK